MRVRRQPSNMFVVAGSAIQQLACPLHHHAAWNPGLLSVCVVYWGTGIVLLLSPSRGICCAFFSARRAQALDMTLSGNSTSEGVQSVWCCVGLGCLLPQNMLAGCGLGYKSAAS